MNPSTEITPNNRIAVRYIRKDIQAALTRFRIFNFDKTAYIKLLDISSSGALILSDLRFSVGKKMVLVLQFTDRKRYYVSVTVIRRTKTVSGIYQYGLKFKEQVNSLGDYILKTQVDLAFK